MLGMAAALCAPIACQAQIDPSKRELIQLGYNLPVEGSGPLNAYAFYYLNVPQFMRSNLTFRLALAPVYLDSELGISRVLGENTDVGLGVAGGGFADTYSEVRRGHYIKAESFTGNGGGVSASLYHLFNPGSQIPLNGVFRLEAHSVFYERDSKTDPNFHLPDDKTTFRLRTGFRWGGKEPVLLPDLAMELSAWYQGEFRTSADRYGFDNQYKVERDSHLFLGEALLIYTLPKLQHNFAVAFTAGTRANRISA